MQKQVCPTTSDSVIGTCSEDCSTDDNCEELEKCCSNGCGHSCMESINIPYYSPPMTCPPIDPAFAIFCNLHFSCESHDVCDEGELCCPRGCGDSCVTAIKPSPLCTAILNSTLQSVSHVLKQHDSMTYSVNTVYMYVNKKASYSTVITYFRSSTVVLTVLCVHVLINSTP